jgi:hypothetical protein
MKPSALSVVKIAIFIFVGVVFAGSIVLYSNSRGMSKEHQDDSDGLYTSNSDDGGSRRYDKQFTVSDGGEVIVDADAGTVEIDSWDKDEVSVVVEIEGTDSRADKYVVDFKQDGNKIMITGKVRDKSFFKWHVGNLDAHYTIQTPKKFSAKVKTSGGNVNARNLIGTVDLNTSGGNVEVEKIEGQTTASTSGGDVNVSDIVGDVDAETSGGNVMCENIVGSVDGHTSGGNVEIRSVDGRVKAGTSGGSVVCKVTGENKGIDAETSGGDIDIYLKENISATIDAETSGGSVDCDLPVVVKGKVRESELHGKINGGGYPIQASTSGGSIRIALLK